MSYAIHPRTELGVVSLKVSDLDRSIAFYQDVIGLKVLSREGNHAVFTANGTARLLELEQIDDAVVVPPRSTTGLYHFAILLPDRTSLGLSLRNLIQHGIRIGQADHLVSEALYISDPDHNGIEIYRDRPRESWTRDAKGNVNMTTDPVDWDGLLAEAENGNWTGMPEETTMGHVHLHVGDLQQAKQFYCDLIGFEIAADASNWGALFVSAGGYHHHLGLNVWAGADAPAVPKNGTGLAYFTIALPDELELRTVINRIKDAGIPVTERDGSHYVADPFGTVVRFIYN